MYSGITTKSDHPSYPLHAIIGADLRRPAAPHGALVLRTRSALSAVMNASRVCEPDRTAALDRAPPCYRVRRGGVRWLALAKCHRITPPTLALSRWQSLRSATAHSPTKNQQSIATMHAAMTLANRVQNPKK